MLHFVPESYVTVNGLKATRSRLATQACAGLGWEATALAPSVTCSRSPQMRGLATSRLLPAGSRK